MIDKTKLLETFPNPNPERNYTIIHTAPEFTSVCPKTGQPDYATIVLEYVPDKICVELKSYKFYLQSYRNEGIYFEAVTNKIANDLIKVMKPRSLNITAKFNTRGGISSDIIVNYKKR